MLISEVFWRFFNFNFHKCQKVSFFQLFPAFLPTVMAKNHRWETSRMSINSHKSTNPVVDIKAYLCNIMLLGGVYWFKWLNGFL
jgi:hypothetical protein